MDKFLKVAETEKKKIFSLLLEQDSFLKKEWIVNTQDVSVGDIKNFFISDEHPGDKWLKASKSEFYRVDFGSFRKDSPFVILIENDEDQHRYRSSTEEMLRVFFVSAKFNKQNKKVVWIRINFDRFKDTEGQVRHVSFNQRMDALKTSYLFVKSFKEFSNSRMKPISIIYLFFDENRESPLASHEQFIWFSWNHSPLQGQLLQDFLFTIKYKEEKKKKEFSNFLEKEKSHHKKETRKSKTDDDVSCFPNTINSLTKKRKTLLPLKLKWQKKKKVLSLFKLRKKTNEETKEILNQDQTPTQELFNSKPFIEKINPSLLFKTNSAPCVLSLEVKTENPKTQAWQGKGDNKDTTGRSLTLLEQAFFFIQNTKIQGKRNNDLEESVIQAFQKKLLQNPYRSGGSIHLNRNIWRFHWRNYERYEAINLKTKKHNIALRYQEKFLILCAESQQTKI